MMFGKKKAGAIAAGLSLVMALSPVAALADETPAPTTTTTPQVEKVLQLNNGSTVKATFEFEAKGTQLSYTDKDGKTVQTEKDVPTLTIDDVTIDNTPTGDGKLDKNGSMSASFGHAGYYAWYVTEKSNTYTGDGVMTYDPDTVYTVIATVSNPDTTKGQSGLQVVYTIKKGKVTSADNLGAKEGTAKFTNKYTEKTNDKGNNKPLTITKTVTGAQGDQTKDFNFTVEFSTPEGFVNNTDWKLGDITAKKGDTDLTNENGKFTFTAKSADEVTFDNIMAGVTYTVTETEANTEGYTTSYEGAANGVATSTNENNLVGEKANNLTVRNDKQGSVVTGVIVNNAPFIVMIGAAAAGVVAYGSAKRKLEK